MGQFKVLAIVSKSFSIFMKITELSRTNLGLVPSATSLTRPMTITRSSPMWTGTIMVGTCRVFGPQCCCFFLALDSFTGCRVGACLRRGLYFLEEWTLDRLEREEHRPVSNQRPSAVVARYRSEHRASWQTKHVANASNNRHIAVLWDELEEPEAVSAIAVEQLPTIIFATKTAGFRDEEHSLPSNTCMQDFTETDHPLGSMASQICGLSAQSLCAHVGHETVHLRRHFPVVDPRQVG